MKRLVLGLAVLLLVGTAAYGDTLGPVIAAPYGTIGPYTMSLNGVSTPLICYSGVNDITWTETWSATAYTSTAAAALVGNPFPGSAGQYNELGYLANELFAAPGNVDLQNAIWLVLGLGGTSTSGTAADLLAASTAVYAGYVTTDMFYIPDSQVNGAWPQPFIGTPEPSSLMLLGAGLLGLIGLSRKVTA